MKSTNSCCNQLKLKRLLMFLVIAIVIALSVNNVILYMNKSTSVGIKYQNTDLRFNADPDFSEEELKNDEYVHNTCSMIPENELRHMIVFKSLKDNLLLKQGGTGHLYHFMQRLMPGMIQAYNNIWGPQGIQSTNMNSSDIYFIFQDEIAIKKLVPFSRFLLASLYTGGEYKRMHIALGKNAKFYDRLVLIEHFQVEYTIDLTKQSKYELFMSNAKSLRQESSIECGLVLHKEPLRSYRKRFHWFMEPESFAIFRKTYSKLCSLTPPSDINDIYTIRPPFYNTNKNPIVYTNSQLNRSNTVVLKDSIEDVRLPLDPDPLNSFLDENDLTMPIKSIWNKESTNNYRRNIIIYQRNQNRNFADVIELKHHLSAYLNAFAKLKSPNVTSDDYKWDVNVFYHDDNVPPCKLIETVSTATGFLDSHGFQSIFTLYQPLAACHIEIQPHFYYQPFVYGELQLSLRQKFNIPRSYFSLESSPTWIIPKILKYFDLIDGVGCQNMKICRQHIRQQSLILPNEFIKNVSYFLNEYFLLPESNHEIN